MLSTGSDEVGLCSLKVGDPNQQLGWSLWGSSNEPRLENTYIDTEGSCSTFDDEHMDSDEISQKLDNEHDLDKSVVSAWGPVLSWELLQADLSEMPVTCKSEINETMGWIPSDFMEDMSNYTSTTYSTASSPQDYWTTEQVMLHGSDMFRAGGGLNSYNCHQCAQFFARVAEIEEHAKKTGHKPFFCCDRSFSRRDAWLRHCETHSSKGQYPCTRCDKYRGEGAFRRRDHLRQHLKKYHRVHPNVEFPSFCPLAGCKKAASYDTFTGFDRRKHYTKHMREAHGKETHACTIEGCERSGTKGFARLNDLERHMKLVHANIISEGVVDLR